MFSSQLREYYRDKLEMSFEAFGNPIEQVFYKSIFIEGSPQTGVLNNYPIIMLPRSSSDKPSLTDMYMKNLGLNCEIFCPKASQHPFRYFSQNQLSRFDPQIFFAASSIGQAMFEIVTPHLDPLDDGKKPSFDMNHLQGVKWQQHLAAKKWINDHQQLVENLISLHSQINLESSESK